MGAVGNVLKGVGKVFGFDQSAITKAAKQQAKATRASALAQLMQDNQAAQQDAQAQANETNQRAAAAAASDLLNQPVDTPTVTANTDTEDRDPLTGALKNRRSAFFATGGGSSSGSGAGVNVNA